jgi:hypothetical protein
MEITHVTTDAMLAYNTTSPVSEDGITLWLPLIVVVVFAIFILCLVVVGRNIFCTKRASQQLIVG